MRWIIVIVLLVAAYWLYTHGYVNAQSAWDYIVSSITEVISTIADFFRGGGAVTK